MKQKRATFCLLLAFAMTFTNTTAIGVGQTRQAVPPQSRLSPYSIEFENLISSAKASAGQVSRQEMQGFGPGWSGNAQLFWGAPPPVDKPIRNWPHLTLLFSSPAGTYNIVLHYTTAPDFGTFRVFLNGEAAADIDGYSSAVEPKTRSLGQHKLAGGSHQLVVTVFTKAGASKGFSVGLDRLQLRKSDTAPSEVLPNPGNLRPQRPKPSERKPPQETVPDVRPNLRPKPQPSPQGQPPGGSPEKSINPEQLTLAICNNSPETCCKDKASLSDGCKLVTQILLEVRIRSYVPPRFLTMGNNYPWDTSAQLSLVSDVTVNSPYKVWPGCRFNPTAAGYTIEQSKSLLQKGGELFEAWLGQWSGGVESAKSYVSQGVGDKVCDIVDDSKSCRDHVAAAVKTGINLGLASLGIPPEIPDVHQLREHGIRYLASKAASSALSDPEILKKLPVDEKTRELLYQQAYDKALDILSTELNKVIPPGNFSSENPGTWGHIEPAYAAHNAHAYVEIKVKPGAYSKYLHFLATNPKHTWAPLYLHDLNHVYASMGPIEVPTFIPPAGIILPIELKPFEVANTKEVPDQIPGLNISKTWLEQKFGLAASDGMVKGQVNWEGARGEQGYRNSDWDLFYDPIRYVKANEIRRLKFRLLMPVGTKGVLDWEKGWDAIVATVRDVDVGYTAMYKGDLHNYYGRIDPAPRCDGKPNVVAY